jgi:hypothetical protein
MLGIRRFATLAIQNIPLFGIGGFVKLGTEGIQLFKP